VLFRALYQQLDSFLSPGVPSPDSRVRSSSPTMPNACSQSPDSRIRKSIPINPIPESRSPESKSFDPGVPIRFQVPSRSDPDLPNPRVLIRSRSATIPPDLIPDVPSPGALEFPVSRVLELPRLPSPRMRNLNPRMRNPRTSRDL